MKIASNENFEVGDMKDAMLERRPLPIGRTQFMEWSDRIIAGAMVEASVRSLRQSLAAMIMHLGPTEAFKPDAYFILSLRKGAANQTAHAIMTEIQAEHEAEKQAEATASRKLEVIDGSLLENKEVQSSKH